MTLLCFQCGAWRRQDREQLEMARREMASGSTLGAMLVKDLLRRRRPYDAARATWIANGRKCTHLTEVEAAK